MKKEQRKQKSEKNIRNTYKITILKRTVPNQNGFLFDLILLNFYNGDFLCLFLIFSKLIEYDMLLFIIDDAL